jgi:uncharacterized protein with HEPN domain
MDEALEAISEYDGDMDFAAWMDDRKTVDAVIRNLENYWRNCGPYP